MACTPGHFCPEGSTVATLCAAGRFASEGAESCLSCPKGSFCLRGAAMPTVCAAGRFGSARELAYADCSGPCARGHWCPANSTSATAKLCPQGTFNEAQGGTDESSCQNCS